MTTVMLPKLLLLVGVPGSGKSSWLKKHGPPTSGFYGYERVCPDEIRKELYHDVSDQTHNGVIWRIAKNRVRKCLSYGTSVVLDATNVSTKNRQDFIKDLPPCKLQAVLFKADPDKCFQRIKKDLAEGKDRSNVPEDVIYKMYGEFLYTEKVIESEGFEIIPNN